MERDNHFDSLRLFAALFVIVTHSFSLLGLPEHDIVSQLSRGALSLSRLGLYTFFALSGYLVCGSLLRSSTLGGFFGKRMVRIFPGLFVALGCTVFLLGPLVSTLGVAEYFSRWETWKYLASASLFRIQEGLPGVFTHVPYARIVNGSLWTLAYEVTLYTLLAVCFWQARKRESVVRAGLGIVLVGLIGFQLFAAHETLATTLPVLLLTVRHLVQFATLFVAGAFLWTLPRTWVLDWRTQAATFGLLALSIGFSVFPGILLLLTLPILLLGLGYASLPALQRVRTQGDYSYGFYIYAFPVQQALVEVVPAGTNPYLFAVIAIIATAPFAIFSWHWVEKPALALKSRLRE